MYEDDSDRSLDLARESCPRVKRCLGSPAGPDTRRSARQRMDQSVPPCGEGVNLISTSTELPQAAIVQASVHGVFDRPVPEVTRVSRTCTRLQPAAVPRLIIAAADAP